MFSSVHPHLQIRFALESLKWQQMIYFRLNDIIPLFQLNNQRLIKRVTVTFLNSPHFTAMHWRAGFNCAVAKSSTGYLTYILKILRSNIVPIAYCIDEPIAIIRFWMQAIQDRKKIDDRKIYESSKCLSSLN